MIMPMWDPVLLVIVIVFAIIGFAVSSALKTKFAAYVKTPLTLSGKEVAEKMLREHQLFDVKVVSVQGQLTDHYNPATKTVNLSTDVYNGRNVSAAAVAAHECGHAVQHATAYTWLGFRTAMVPVLNFSSVLLNIILIGALFGSFALPGMQDNFILIYIAFQALMTLFSIITLPVEVDASNRALSWLNSAYITRTTKESNEAKDALRWAGYTYFVAALASLTTLLYLLMQYSGRRE